MKTRVRALLTDKDGIILIYREKPDRKYYVFPGGGVEPGETPESALQRECNEELGLTISVHDKKYSYKEKNGDVQHFYHCSIKAGVLGTGKGPEFTSGAYSTRGQYHPKTIPLNSVSGLPLFPDEIREALSTDLSSARTMEELVFREVPEK